MSATRRGTLAAFTALAAGALPVASAEPSADAEVIRLADAVVQAEIAYRRSYYPADVTAEEEEARQPEHERLACIRDAAIEALNDVQATTLAGVIAKARAAYALADWRMDGSFMELGLGEDVALGLVEDVLALGGEDLAALVVDPRTGRTGSAA